MVSDRDTAITAPPSSIWDSDFRVGEYEEGGILGKK